MRILSAAVALLFSISAYAQAPSCPSMHWTLDDESSSPYWVPTLEPVDFDEDGKLDLVGVAQDGIIRYLEWWKGAGDGTFGEPVELGTAQFMSNVVIADATGDGRLDVLVVADGETGAYLWTYPGTGSGRTRVTQPFTSIPHTLIAPNMDADPEAELVASWGWGGFTVYDRIGGGYSQTQDVAGSGARRVASADFDGDGRYDVAIAMAEGRNEGYGADDRVAVYFRKADGSFDPPVSLYTPQPWGLTSGDIDDDGKPDLIAGNWIQGTLDPGTITVYRNTGNRTFAESVIVTERPGPPTSVSDPMEIDIADMDADGNSDLVVTVVNGSWIATFAGLGDGTFRTPTFLSGYWPSTAAIADFDANSTRDLAIGTNDKIVSFTRSCATEVWLYAESYMISTGQEAILRAQISGFHPGVAVPRGTMTLREGGTDLATVDVDADGWASFNITGLTSGDHNLFAVFSGNSEIGSATSNTVMQRVTTATTSLTVTIPPQTVHGHAFIVDFDIQNTDYGYVEVSVDGGPKSVRYTSVPLALTLPAGPHSITARYLGLPYRPKSNAVTVNFTTAKDTPQIAFSGALTVRQGTAHQLTVTVSTTGTLGVPTGNVHLYEDGTTLLGSAVLSNGVANFSRTFARGPHALRAVYEGSTNFESVSVDARAEVLQNIPYSLSARSLANGIQIDALMQDANAASLQLQRRVAGTTSWQNVAGFTGMTSGIDASVARGIAYEYQMTGTMSGGTPIMTNIDSAIFFTDDGLTAGTLIKRTHFTELATAVNLMRAEASLAPFAYHANFTTPGLIRESHLNALRTAAMEARTALGMTTPALTTISAGGAVKVFHLNETRDLVR